ncbi:hypothetical protein FQN60_007264 [Etheostoma spectabile]|uniref:PH domain-containing protein n=1 Tax=Etheostoma spectabile TaxID=54343 RepID=A0A5J5CBB3_9PERO|nr:hypothetical protein FQN60_007264 [Etheostoma spectabile]
MTDSVVVEGYARLRDGKKWKTRWLVLRKPSPVADCLVLLVFKDKSEKAQGNKERASIILEEICGLELGQWYEGVAFTLALLCLNQAALLGFDSKEALQAWDARLRYSLGEDSVLESYQGPSWRVDLQLFIYATTYWLLPGTSLPLLSATGTFQTCADMGLYPMGLCSREEQDVVTGPVFFCLHLLRASRSVFYSTASSEAFPLPEALLDCGQFCQTNSEERLNHEAQELEKRLSMLSHRCSTVSSSYSQSAGGDDHSISGSSDTSDTSQSDCSIGSRVAIWTEPSSNPSEHVGAKAAFQSFEKLSVNQRGGNRPAVKPPRQLQEIGRQSSSDSGIATGSHSSYTGSFSSYTGSLDITHGEDFGSVFSLPPHLAQDLSPCICVTVPGHEYQVPTSLRYLYDSPRSLLQEGSEGVKDNEPSTQAKDTPASSRFTTDSAKEDKISTMTFDAHSETNERQSVSEHCQGTSEKSNKTKVPCSSQHPDSYHICSSLTSVSKTIVTICSVCGGFKGTQYIAVSGAVIPAIPDRQPEAKTKRLNLYESMSPRFGNELKSLATGTCVPTPDLQQDRRSVIYENCLKCQGEHCQPPPRVVPAEMYRNRNISTLHIVPTGLNLKNSHEQEVDANEELLYQAPGDGSQSVDGQCRYEEMNGWTWTGEDKRSHNKEERRRADAAYEVMESRAPERNPEAEEKSKYALMGSCGQQRFLQETEGAVFVFPPEAPLPERPRSEGVTYVNIPVSPTSKKQLNYMELELQEPGKSSTKYAQIDITATETAHKVGTQHALGRQEGLHTLELRRKGTLH